MWHILVELPANEHAFHFRYNIYFPCGFFGELSTFLMPNIDKSEANDDDCCSELVYIYSDRGKNNNTGLGDGKKRQYSVYSIHSFLLRIQI